MKDFSCIRSPDGTMWVMAKRETLTRQQLKRIREQLGLSQEEFALELGVGRTAVNRWESGDRSIAPAMAKLIRFVEREMAERVSA